MKKWTWMTSFLWLIALMAACSPNQLPPEPETAVPIYVTMTPALSGAMSTSTPSSLSTPTLPDLSQPVATSTLSSASITAIPTNTPAAPSESSSLEEMNDAGIADTGGAQDVNIIALDVPSLVDCQADPVNQPTSICSIDSLRYTISNETIEFNEAYDILFPNEPVMTTGRPPFAAKYISGQTGYLFVCSWSESGENKCQLVKDHNGEAGPSDLNPCEQGRQQCVMNSCYQTPIPLTSQLKCLDLKCHRYLSCPKPSSFPTEID